MQDLEDIKYTDVIHPNAICYAEWRKQLRPNYFLVYRDMIIGYLVLIGLVFMSALVSPQNIVLFIITILIGSVLLGFLFAYISLFLHEAGHFNLHKDKLKNDLITNIFLGSLFGIDIGSYRKIHWQHHLHLGTTADTETSYYHAPDAMFVIESFTGIHLIKVINNKQGSSVLTKKMKKDSIRMLLISAGLNLFIVAMMVIGDYWAAAISWVAGMLIFFPFFAAIRQILEHRNESAEKNADYTRQSHGRVSRIFGSDLFSRIFGGAGFNKHMIHHWDPHISYTRLKEIETFLSDCERTRSIMNASRTGYLKTFRKLATKTTDS